MDRDAYLTVQEIADHLRVAKMTIYRLIHTGELPAIKVGHSFRVERATFDRWLQSNKDWRHP